MNTQNDRYAIPVQYEHGPQRLLNDLVIDINALFSRTNLNVKLKSPAAHPLDIKNAEDRVYQERLTYLASLWEIIRVRSDNHQHIIGFFNNKGGTGKSPIAATAAVSLKHSTMETILALDCNSNAGNLNRWLGIDMITSRMTTVDVVDRKNPQTFVDHAIMQKSVYKHQNKLWVIPMGDDDSEKLESKSGDRQVTAIETGIDAVDKHVHSIVIDTGNKHTDAYNRAAFNKSTAHVFTGLQDNVESLSFLLATMSAYANQDKEQEVRNSRLAIARTQGESREQLFEKLAGIKGPQTLDDLGVTPDSIYPIHWSDYLSTTHNEVNTVNADPAIMGVETLIGIAEMLAEIFKFPGNNQVKKSESKGDTLVKAIEN